MEIRSTPWLGMLLAAWILTIWRRLQSPPCPWRILGRPGMRRRSRWPGRPSLWGSSPRAWGWGPRGRLTPSLSAGSPRRSSRHNCYHHQQSRWPHHSDRAPGSNLAQLVWSWEWDTGLERDSYLLNTPLPMTFPSSSWGLVAARWVWVSPETSNSSVTASCVVLASSATIQWAPGTSLRVLASLVRSGSCVGRE